jgi:hypothetical protein
MEAGSTAAARLPRLPLWVWIEYPVIPRYIQLNLLAMQLHAAGSFELKLLNRSTLATHLALPAEFDRIPYAVAASDYARIGLLAEHGGLYADADVRDTRVQLASVHTQPSLHSWRPYDLPP